MKIALRWVLCAGVCVSGWGLNVRGDDKPAAAPKAEEKKSDAAPAAKDEKKPDAKPTEKKDEKPKGDEKKDADKKEKSDGLTLEKVLEEHTLATFKAVEGYLKDHPDAEDIDKGYLWLFQNGMALHREPDVLKYTEEYIGRDQANPQLKQVAYQVQAIGYLRQKKYQQAVKAYEHLLEGGARRTANQVIEFGFGLAAKIQAAGDIATSRSVYEKITDAFPLNEELGKMTKRKLDRMDLIGQAPPSLSKGKDWEGKNLDLDKYKGKVVLIDFWATNCPPCMAELPNLLRTYQQFHDQGLEIVGISLDEDRSKAEQLRDRAQIKWRMAMNKVDDSELGEAYFVPTIPAVFLVDREGKIAHVDLTGEDLREAVARLLKDSSSEGEKKSAEKKVGEVKPAELPVEKKAEEKK